MQKWQKPIFMWHPGIFSFILAGITIWLHKDDWFKSGLNINCESNLRFKVDYSITHWPNEQDLWLCFMWNSLGFETLCDPSINYLCNVKRFEYNRIKLKKNKSLCKLKQNLQIELNKRVWKQHYHQKIDSNVTKASIV